MKNIDKIRLIEVPSTWKVKDDDYTYTNARLVGPFETIEVVELLIGSDYGYVKFKDTFGYLTTYNADTFFKVFEVVDDE